MFELNETLRGDSVPILEDDDFVIRMINDARFPWMLIVPKVEGARELHDLDEATYTRAMLVARQCGVVLKQIFKADKINTAAIGNMVSQLHIHVVARQKGDAAWPGPVWGVGEMEAFSDEDMAERVAKIRRALSDQV